MSAFTYKSRRLAYDNIASGSAAGRENIIAAGESPTGDFTTKPNADSGGNTSTSVLAIARQERLIRNGSSDSTGQTSNNISEYTSETSISSNFPEVVG